MTQAKEIMNALYHAAVLGSLAIGFAQVGKTIMKGSALRLALTPYDAGMVVADLALAICTRDMLVENGVISADISN